MQGRRIAHRPVSAQEFRAVACGRTRRVVDIEERDPIGKFIAVGISCIQRTVPGIDLGRHVHGRLGTQIPQHPLDVSGGGQPSGPAGPVAHLQHHELDRLVERHENGQL